MDEQDACDVREEETKEPLCEEKVGQSENSYCDCQSSDISPETVNLGNGGDAQKALDNPPNLGDGKEDLACKPPSDSGRGSEQTGNGDFVKSESILEVADKDACESEPTTQSETSTECVQAEHVPSDAGGSNSLSVDEDKSGVPENKTEESHDKTDISPGVTTIEAGLGLQDVSTDEKHEKTPSSKSTEEMKPSLEQDEEPKTAEDIPIKSEKTASGERTESNVDKKSENVTKEEEKDRAKIKGNSLDGDKQMKNDRPRTSSGESDNAPSRDRGGGGGGGGGKSYSAQRSSNRPGRQSEDDNGRVDDRSKSGRSSLDSNSSGRGGRDVENQGRGARDDQRGNRDNGRGAKDAPRGGKDDDRGGRNDGRAGKDSHKGGRDDVRSGRNDGRGGSDDRRGTRDDRKGGRDDKGRRDSGGRDGRAGKDDGRGNRDDRRGSRDEGRGGRDDGKGRRDDQRGRKEDVHGRRDDGKGGRDDRKMDVKKDRDRRDRDQGPLEKSRDSPRSSKDRDRQNHEHHRDKDRHHDRRETESRSGRRTDDHHPSSKGREERMKEDEEKKKKDEEAKRIEEEKRKEEERIKKEEEKKRREEEQKRLEEEAARKKEEEEEKHARESHAEALERKEAKEALRKKNLSASTDWPDEEFFVKLDSSLKKNTAFVRKLKTLSEQQRDALAKEFNGLNLTKYVGEAAIAFSEAKMKMADISCAIYLASLFHQRYGEFSSQLLQGLQRAFPTPQSKKEEKDSKQPVVFDSKIRVELRFLAELVVSGIFTEKEGLPLLNNLLSSIMKSDKESHNNIAIIISFTKHCGEDFAGIVSRKHRMMAEKYGLDLVVSDVFSTQLKTAYKNLLKDHYSSLAKYLERQHKDLQNMERQNRRSLQNKGELSEERRKKHEEKQTAYQKLLMNTSTFADLIDEDMPDLPEEQLSQDELELMAIDMMRGDSSLGEFDWANSLWEDEDTRTFHENLIHLRSMVPAILFKDIDQNPPDKQEDKEAEDLDKLDSDIKALEMETDAAEVMEQGGMETVEEEEEEEPTEETTGQKKAEEEVELAEIETGDADDDEEGEQVSNATLKMLMDAYINGLPNCVNRDHIDKAAVDFCLNLNTKQNRKKLAKALFNVPRVRLDLLPFYSRLVATLHVCMPDIAADLNERLKNEFRWQVRKKDQMMIESKIKVSRFIGELTKFKMFSKADTLQCLKSLIQDFKHHNIDMACALLESAGRFLFRSPDSHLKTMALLDLMMRKKSKMILTERHNTMIENAFFYCNPPEVTKVERKVRPPMHEYIRKLLYKDLSKTTVEKVLKQLRKLPWDNQEIKQYAIKCMSNIWNVKYNNLHCLANLLAGLVAYHDDAGIQIVDAILEDVRIGMEINHPKYNQRRVSVVKFLGELYNYRMVESSVIFKTLYTLIRFGIALDDSDTPLDPPEHLFRIRLVCTLLDTCGQFFDRGTSKKKLDCFLTYFQQYILYKKSLPVWTSDSRPFPMDVDNAISDTLEMLRPNLHLFSSLEEANTEVEKLEKDTIKKVSSLLPEVHLNIVQPPHTGHGLTSIAEGNEDQANLSQGIESMSLNDEDDDMSDDEDGRVRRMTGTHSATNSPSQNTGGTGEEQDELYHDYGDQEALDSAGEVEEDDFVTVITGGPKLLKCDEDDDFTTAFDKMLSENIQQRNAESLKVTQQLDIGVPLHIKARSTTKPTPANPFQLASSPENDPSTVNFVLMTRKGNKQHFREFEVDVGSELAANLKNREEAEKAEKQRMKELTLTINERQEEEDYEEMLASMQKPATCVPVQSNKSRFVHPKGAPNSEQIFNARGNRKW